MALSEVPTMTEPHTKEAPSKGQMVFNKDFSYLHSQSISANFGNMLAQNPRKPSKIGKHKTKKRPPEDEDGLHGVRLEKSKPTPNFLPPPPSKMLLSQPLNIPQRPPPVNYAATPPSRMAYPDPTNPWQTQTSNTNHVGVTKDEVMNNFSSGEDMDLSSGSEAETPVQLNQLDGALELPLAASSHQPEVSHFLKVNDLSDCMELSSGPEADDVPEERSSVSRRASTTPPFNDSAASSHTSAVLTNDARSPIDDTRIAEKELKAPSPMSDLSSQLSPAKSTTPVALRPSIEPFKQSRTGRIPRAKRINFSERRPRTAIPENLTAATIASQGIHAALASRLNPFVLHHQEYQLLRDHISHLHVTAYLNIRNRILRLWVRNPLVQVTSEEAAGCAQSSRWLGLAKVAYEWLVRRGYINFGCLEIPNPPDLKVKRYKMKRVKRKTIVVVGAGMAGLGCARQLEGLIKHYQEKWTAAGEETPKVVVLEGRNRIGGRLYSHPFKNQHSSGIPEGKRSTAELGAHIIIGFDHGNPLSMIVQGQLALHYHTLKDNSTLHDVDGSVVDVERDGMVEQLYNDCLDRASAYRHRMPHPLTVEGDEDLITLGRDPQQKGGPLIAEVETETPNIPAAYSNDDTENVPGGMDKLTGKAHMITGPRKKEPPAVAAKRMGWVLGETVLHYDDLNLDAVAKSSKHPTLGAAMDEAVKQYQFLLDLTPQDMRLINWHYANLEYANAANVGKLSLGGWDQDAGNEFMGGHAQIIGGYQQVPRAILQAPTKLDLRTHKVVKKVEYSIWSGTSKTPGARVQCEDGESIDADYVILTSPLGVLKDRAIEFSPPLPDWKLGPIDRLGYGLLNKCILVYDEPFWDVNQDMFGLLREAEVPESLDQEDYVANRGRFYFFWNCVKTSGRPVLISLMAGDAAYQAENTSDAELVAEVTQELSKIFKEKAVPWPQECIITRWGSDPFARGTYSFVGAEAIPGDYDMMAARVGNLHFAGEATCATHPATVHGAYISGLRAASEIIDDLLGPIEVPKPLVSWPTATSTVTEPMPQVTPPKSPQEPPSEPRRPLVATTVTPTDSTALRSQELSRFEAEIIDALNASLGLRPIEPKSARGNPFTLYTRDHWNAVKQAYGLRGNNDIRAKIGSLWTALSAEEKQPYKDRVKEMTSAREIENLTFAHRDREWNAKAVEFRRQYIRDHPFLTEEEEKNMWAALGEYGQVGSERKAKIASGYSVNGRDEDVAMTM